MNFPDPNHITTTYVRTYVCTVVHAWLACSSFVRSSMYGTENSWQIKSMLSSWTTCNIAEYERATFAERSTNVKNPSEYSSNFKVVLFCSLGSTLLPPSVRREIKGLSELLLWHFSDILFFWKILKVNKAQCWELFELINVSIWTLVAVCSWVFVAYPIA